MIRTSAFPRFTVMSIAWIALLVLSAPAPARAGDFFSMLFGAFSRPSAPRVDTSGAPLGYDNDGDDAASRPRVPIYGSSGSAYCVRTCDGRYFPAPASDRMSRVSACQSFCPASDTRVYYGGSIDNAVEDTGKPYSELPNAFRYRSEMVSGCTCNGTDATGLAKIKIEDDPTLRNGDIVASADGLMVAKRGDRRGSGLNFSPVPASVQAKYQRPKVMASE